MSVKSTREIYLETCESIANCLTSDGFQYVKSSQILTKSDGDISLKIPFHSSTFNMKRRKIELGFHVSIHSKRLKKWRSTQPQCFDRKGKVDDWIIAPRLNHIHPNHMAARWNLNDAENRPWVIENAVDSIRSYIVPFFYNFKNPDNIKHSLIQGTFNGLQGNPLRPIEYALCYFDSTIAKKYVIAYLNRVKCSKRAIEGLDDFIESYSRMEFNDLGPEGINGISDLIAFYSIRYGWGNLAQEIT